MSQQQRQQTAQNANILVNQQSPQSGLVIGTNQQKQQIQFIHTTQTSGGQQQVKIIQSPQQQHVMTGQHMNKPLVQGQPQQRIIISQQQFNQLNQQQQQLLNSSQNQNIVIINQQPGGQQQQQQMLNPNNQQQQQTNLLQQQQVNNLGQGQSTQQMTNQQVMLQKGVTNIQQSPQPMQQQQQQIDQQSPQHQQNASSPQSQSQLNAQRMQYIQQQQTIQQIKMQLQQQVAGNTNNPQQATLVTPQTQSGNQSPIIHNQPQQQQIIQGQQVQSVPSPQQQQQSQQQIIPTQQKIQIQNQIIVQQQQPGLVQPQNILVNQWTPQSPVQQGQANVGQPQQQFIRTQRPQQWPPQAGNQPQRQLIHLDAATHAHLQTLDPIRRTEYLTKLQQKQQRERNLMLRQQAFQGRPNAPNIVTGQRSAGAQHIIVLSQMPAGMTQQQQLLWLQVQQQQNVRQPLLVRGGAPGLSPISQTVSPIPQQQQFVDPNNPSAQQHQQQLQQLQIQRQQQYQRLQQIQQQQQQNRTQGQPVSPRGFTAEVNPDLSSVVTTPTTPGAPNQIQLAQDPNSQASMNSKTKTALANIQSLLDDDSAMMTLHSFSIASVDLFPETLVLFRRTFSPILPGKSFHETMNESVIRFLIDLVYVDLDCDFVLGFGCELFV